MTYKKTFDFLGLPDLEASVVVPTMLTIYKYGIAEIPSDMATLKALATEGLITVQLARGHSACTLTETGADWVNKHFFQMLTDCPLSYTYPVLLPGDEIQLLKDIVKPVGYVPTGSVAFKGPSHQMDRGRYFLQLITKGRIVLVDDCDVPYELLLKNCGHLLSFRQDQLTTLDNELKKRFHRIKIKSLVKRLNKSVNTLTLTEWVEELYNKSYTRWRMGE